MSLLKISWRNPAVLIICFLMVVAIRFDRNDLLVKRPLNDAAFYIANVQFLRGETLTYTFKGPFNERLLVTTLAAFLPFEPLTAINFANIFFLLLAIYVLSLLLRELKLSNDLVWFGLYLFVFSFPNFYYSTIGYTDPGVLSMIFLGVYALYTNKYGLFALSVLLGAVAKESIVLLLPVSLAYAYSRSSKSWYVISGVGLLVFLTVSILVKNNIAEQVNTSFYWHPSISRTLFNLSRPNFYLSSILSLGIPGLLCMAFFLNKKSTLLQFWKEDLPLITGIVVAFFPWLYMIPSAFPDGRAFWIASCFPIALAMVWWGRYGNPFKTFRVEN